jgi:hypothetical protein
MPAITQPGDIAARGEAIFREQVEPRLGGEHKGRFVVIDVDSGDFEIAETDAVATSRLKERHPPGRFYGLRIGHRTAYRLGARSLTGDQ